MIKIFLAHYLDYDLDQSMSRYRHRYRLI